MLKAWGGFSPQDASSALVIFRRFPTITMELATSDFRYYPGCALYCLRRNTKSIAELSATVNSVQKIAGIQDARALLEALL